MVATPDGPAEPPSAQPQRRTLRVKQTSALAVCVTTLALVVVASGGTAVMVEFGAGGGPSAGAPGAATGPLPRTRQPSADVIVDRIVGTVGGPAPARARREAPTLRQLLAPPAGRPPVTPPAVPLEPQAPAAEPPAPLPLPTEPPGSPPPPPEPPTPPSLPPLLPLLPSLPLPLPPLPLPAPPVPPLPGT